MSYKWIGFVKTGTLVSSVIHFFGAASGISAPYPMNCSITIFGNGVDKRSVILEGMRLYQPDGVKIDDIFPALKESARTLGVVIEISCSQQKIDLSVTNCFIEINEQGVRGVYGAQLLAERKELIEFAVHDDNGITMSTVCIDPKLGSVKELSSIPSTEETVETPFGKQQIKHFSLEAKVYENCGLFLCSYDKNLNTLLSVTSI